MFNSAALLGSPVCPPLQLSRDNSLSLYLGCSSPNNDCFKLRGAHKDSNCLLHVPLMLLLLVRRNQHEPCSFPFGFLFGGTEIKPSTSSMQSKGSAVELQPWPYIDFWKLVNLSFPTWPAATSGTAGALTSGFTWHYLNCIDYYDLLEAAGAADLGAPSSNLWSSPWRQRVLEPVLWTTRQCKIGSNFFSSPGVQWLYSSFWDKMSLSLGQTILGLHLHILLLL